jgi:CubicO group peptidase (beta-lactamase class C family)
MKPTASFALMTAILLLTSCSAERGQPDEPLGTTSVGPPARSLAEFETVVARVRSDLKIPGLSAAITKNGRTVWARGYGQADRESGRAATPETVYHLASLTKPFAATVIMQLVEGGVLDLETPVSDYGIHLEAQGVVRVKHLLSHTSEGVPGAAFRYSGNRFAYLDDVIRAAAGRTFCDLLNERLLVPHHWDLTGPYPSSFPNCLINDPRTALIRARMAQGYTSNGQYRLAYQEYFGTAAGLVSNVLDLCAFSIAFDNDLLVLPASRELMLTPYVSNSGEGQAYGLGWFIDDNESARIVWHYGYWDAASTLIMKFPDRNINFVVLANSDRLSSASPGLGSDEDVNRSVIAQEFLNAFIYGTAELPDGAVDRER